MIIWVVAVAVAIVAAFGVRYLWRRSEMAAADKRAQAKVLLQHRRESVQKEVAAQRELMELLYYSCDNFAKHSGTIAEKMEQMYKCGTIQGVCANIVHLANLVENGAMDKLAREYSLTQNEQRICSYIHLGFKWQECCTAESITENAYGVRCSRIRKKLGLSKEEKIPVFIADYCNKVNSSGL